jgi:hypothetical protein
MSTVSTNETKLDAVAIDKLVLAEDPGHWRTLGFTVCEGAVQLGDVRLELAGQDAGEGIVGWSLRDVLSSELDGLPTTRSEDPARAQAAEHPNGLISIDHVVVISPALERTVQALQDAGLELRRIREQPTPAGAPRQAFFRLGAVILEVVQEPDEVIERAGGADRPARFWGLALLADELDRTVAGLGEHVSEIRAAVQPGRRIATLRRSAGLAVPVALMSRAENSNER